MKEGFDVANWGVITDDREKARKLFEEIKAFRIDIDVETEIDDVHEMRVQFSDGVCLRWRAASTYSYGFRMTRARIDRNIPPHILQPIIYPMLLCEDNDIVWI